MGNFVLGWWRLALQQLSRPRLRSESVNSRVIQIAGHSLQLSQNDVPKFLLKVRSASSRLTWADDAARCVYEIIQTAVSPFDQG
jgi:hypothetical protein